MDQDRPSIREMRAFLALERWRNFSEAARELSVSQPSLSRAIAALERHLGHRLFERASRPLELTPEGTAFREMASKITLAHARELRHFDRVSGGAAGSATIAAIPSVAAIVLPKIVSAFVRTHPDATIRIRDAPADEVADLLLGAEADIAISLPPVARDGIARRPLTADEFQLVCDKNHEASAIEAPTWADAARYPLAALNGSSSVSHLVDSTFRRLGLAPRTLFEVSTTSALGGITATGLSVAILPSLVVPLLGFADLSTRTLVEPVVHRKLEVLYSSAYRLGGTARLFLQFLAEREQRPSLPAGAHWLDRPATA